MGIGSRHSQHSFAQIPEVNIGRSKFDRSYTVKDTFDFDYLIPFYVDEILPGDTFNCNVNVFARLATQIVPYMDNAYVDYFFFFVPNRLTYEYWERMNGSQPDPDSSTDFILPVLSGTSAFSVGSLFDKMGLPTGVTSIAGGIQTLPFRAYNLIWNEWFRDQNLQDSIVVQTDQGPDSPSQYVLKKRGKRHDYFTSCLPFLQKGPAVELPLGTSAWVKGIGKGNQGFPETNVDVYEAGGTLGTVTYPYATKIDFAVSANQQFYVQGTAASGVDPNIYADLSTATAATINQLRQAFQMQSLFELDARGGTRYVEILKAHFGVISPDFRLQRPEFLGGGESRINVHPVAQTAPTSGSNPQAQLASFATTSASGQHIGFTKSFVEHGYVIGLACARADITYQQGINRMWSRSTRYDFFWPKLQELGEQAVLNKEIFAAGTSADDDTFGYQERYAEYRYKPSEIHGEFRSTYTTSLDYWHLAQEFSVCPTLNGDFIEQNTPVDRVIAVNTEPHLLFDAYINLKCARPMVAYPQPAALGRF